ncbi:matrixin family metalloprotease [Pelagicoccus sp. SDUM812002]|uniref:matrixin family metalloprotease n=1 Tax=Pelagicoccus sp. SDUM812002 TaxID=3041266 RepID=UPI00280D24B3|nr:matrixin family metalloprotease [Pelagicoccus sp. SDUM812002]MDQ8185762.1 matrixin family metalloprotease [Pelagicoccus sp. SDUM812002]
MLPTPRFFFNCLLCYVFLAGCQLSSSYTLSGYKWPQPDGLGTEIEVSYSFSNLLDGGFNTVLPNSELKEIVVEAFGLWSGVAPLAFVEVDSPVSHHYSNIEIGYRTFDPLYASAIAFYPASIDDALSGDIFFANNINDPYVWGKNTGVGDDPFELDVLEVLVHEIGHSLGLGHEFEADAIMNPTIGNRFSGSDTGYLLQDDIAGIQAIYGKRRSPQAVSDASLRGFAPVVLGLLFVVRRLARR